MLQAQLELRRRNQKKAAGDDEDEAVIYVEGEDDYESSADEEDDAPDSTRKRIRDVDDDDDESSDDEMPTTMEVDEESDEGSEDSEGMIDDEAEETDDDEGDDMSEPMSDDLDDGEGVSSEEESKPAKRSTIGRAGLKSRLSTIMSCFAWFWRKTGNRHLKDRNDRPRDSEIPHPSSGVTSPPLRAAGTSQPLSHSTPRTSSPQPARWASGSTRSSTLTVRAVPLNDPVRATHSTLPNPRRRTHNHRLPSTTDTAIPTPTSAPRRYIPGSTYHLRSNMTVSRTDSYGPPDRGDSPTLPVDWAPSGMTFRERMARASTQALSTAAVQHPTFLDDASDGEETSQRDSGYVSASTTPATHRDTQRRCSDHTTIQSRLYPDPLFFNKPLPRAEVRTPQTPSPRTDASLCNHRPCLRHKQTCLEHTPTPAPSTRASRIPAPETQPTRQRRRARGSASRRLDADVWMQVAREYPAGP
ncbi:hypothetical protein OPT61_g10545 [Boeremia exigua]|uniref:Uncharacterized protein n=1 Tax=Boeremia exigua TaxID=749465 RepID=A0ACC2HP32_9PLEO|nr:hypothetical protein OPT61_g10545 [Boeremia exigua]